MKAGKLNKLRLATKYNDLGLKISFGKQPVSAINNETIYYATFFNNKSQSKSCTVVFRFKLIQFKQDFGFKQDFTLPKMKKLD